MKTLLSALGGAAVGGAACFAFLNANPPGASSLESAQQQLESTRFDLAASKKAETRLREQVAELQRTVDASNEQIAAAVEARKEGKADAAETKDGSSGFADVMRDFGKAQSDLAFATLVDRLGLEGADLTAFTAMFDAMRKQRQEAFSKFVTGGLTMEDLAIIDGYTPGVDDWFAANLDAEAKGEYEAYKAEQEINRIERKANEELTWLSSVANLSREQKDAAYDIFADHLGREKPDDVLEIDSMDTFRSQWDKSMGSRIDALSDVLEPPQLEAYVKNTETMLKMVEGMLEGAIGDE